MYMTHIVLFLHKYEYLYVLRSGAILKYDWPLSWRPVIGWEADDTAWLHANKFSIGFSGPIVVI